MIEFRWDAADVDEARSGDFLLPEVLGRLRHPERVAAILADRFDCTGLAPAEREEA